MQRIPEPELMDEAEQALAYANGRLRRTQPAFRRIVRRRIPRPRPGAVLDLGCGPGDIVLRLAQRLPGLTVHGLDGSAAMLAHGQDTAR